MDERGGAAVTRAGGRVYERGGEVVVEATGAGATERRLEEEAGGGGWDGYQCDLIRETGTGRGKTATRLQGREGKGAVHRLTGI